ncbi:MAG TPA: pseudouridine synthase [Coleofasciculaceae cyanobacterium]
MSAPPQPAPSSADRSPEQFPNQSPGQPPPQRLQKVLAQWGLASRRHAEAWIAAGRVRVNGQVATIGTVVDPQVDRIDVDGRRVGPADRPDPIYLLMNKPARVLSACADDRHRPTVLDLLPRSLIEQTGIHPVGRLDWDSTGALLLTNDGDLTHALTHPRFHLPKTYRVWVQGQPTAATLDRWRSGVLLDGRKTLPADVRLIQTTSTEPTLPARTAAADRSGKLGKSGKSSKAGKSGQCSNPDRDPRPYDDRRDDRRTELEIILVEGRNRQIRRVAELFGHPVIKLHRIAIGFVTLRSPDGSLLPSGAHRNLTPAEVQTLRQRAGLD